MSDWLLFCLACDHFIPKGYEVPSDPAEFDEFINTMKLSLELWQPFQDKIDVWNKVDL